MQCHCIVANYLLLHDRTGTLASIYIYTHIYIYIMYKLYHTTSGISLLLHDAKANVRQSVNNYDIPQV